MNRGGERGFGKHRLMGSTLMTLGPNYVGPRLYPYNTFEASLPVFNSEVFRAIFYLT